VTRRLLRLAFALLVLALALVVAEFAARVVFRHARTSGNARDFVAQHRPPPDIRTNSLGFREREIPPTSDRYRIVVVGDSFTWGQGVDERDRFSDLIGDALGPRYEVFNFGRPGDNMPEHLEVLAQALRVSPDFVLLQLYINDFETASMQRPEPKPLLPARWDRTLERSSLLYDLLRDEWATVQQQVGITDSYARYMERNLRDPASPNARLAYGQLGEFFDRARAAGVHVGCVLFPAPDSLGPYGRDYPFGYLHEGVRRICAEKQVPCLDLLPLYSTVADPRTLWVSPFDAHPNAMSHHRAAEQILSAFRSVWR